MSTRLPICAPIAMKTASKWPSACSVSTSFDLVVEGELNPHGFDAVHFLHEVGAWQAIGGDAEMQHATGQRTRVADFNAVATAGEVVGR